MTLIIIMVVILAAAIPLAALGLGALLDRRAHKTVPEFDFAGARDELLRLYKLRSTAMDIAAMAVEDKVRCVMAEETVKRATRQILILTARLGLDKGISYAQMYANQMNDDTH